MFFYLFLRQLRLIMEEKEMSLEYKKAITYTDLAYVLVDVANSFLVDAEPILNRANKMLRYSERQKMNRVVQSVKQCKYHTKEMTKQMYACACADAACNDSDWLRDIIFLIVDRTGEDENLMEQLRSTIFNSFRSKLGIYEQK